MDGVRQGAAEVLEAHWRDEGFTCPNAATYPWLWLWDSCFHSIVWAELGRADRAVAELEAALGGQNAEGFVPHMRYMDGSTDARAFWGPGGGGRVPTSSITQPPVYGHAVAELQRRSVDVPDDLVDRAVSGVRFLLHRRRRSPAGLVELVHPWESGCDHSPRWDDLMVDGAAAPATGGADRFDDIRWFERKGELVATVHRSPHGSPLWNDEFPVGSVAFSSVVAFCAEELAWVTGDRALADDAADLAAAVHRRWDPGLRTWVDDGPTAGGSGRVRTAEALLGVLVDPPDGVASAVVGELTDPDAFGGRYGPAQVHRDEPTRRAGSYWRGPSWPQLDHLLWWGLTHGRHAHATADPAVAEGADVMAAAARAGAVTSGWAEYWDSDTAAPGGARPQSWTTLAVCWPS